MVYLLEKIDIQVDPVNSNMYCWRVNCIYISQEKTSCFVLVFFIPEEQGYYTFRKSNRYSNRSIISKLISVVSYGKYVKNSYNSTIKKDSILKYTNDLHRYFSKENMQMVGKQMKQYSKSLAIRKMPIRTSIRGNFTPTKLAVT